MTCFWDSIRESLNLNLISNEEFINNLKNKNNLTKDIKWNNEYLNDKQLEENYQHIKNFEISDIYNGYDCSSCEPFLFLIANIYKKNIYHNYNGIDILYYKSIDSSKLSFSSNTGHFWYNKHISNNILNNYQNNVDDIQITSEGPTWDPPF